MGKWVVQVLRTESIAFEVEASSREDAEARYLREGEEVASSIVSTEVECIDAGTASEVLG